uniref:Uncharacterized protein n=1 Tax=Magallana gigas TaxID=29159 RepID=A0A8W8KJP1_MAGGI
MASSMYSELGQSCLWFSDDVHLFDLIELDIQLTAENEKLKKKCWKLKVERDDLQTELSTIKQKLQREELLKNYVTTRESSTQTEGIKTWQPMIAVKKKEEPSFKADAEQTNKYGQEQTNGA